VVKTILKVIGLVVLVLVVAAGAVALYIDRSGLPHYPPGHVTLKVDVTPERVERGRKTVEMLCVACHLDLKTGALSGKRMDDMPPQFGVAYSANITKDPEYGIGTWTDGEIAYLLRTGIKRDGTYAPPWMIKLPHLSDEDLEDVIAFLRSDDPLVRPVPVRTHPSEPSFFAKFLVHVAFKALPYPKGPVFAPDPSDKVAYGRYLVQGKGQCFGCHSADFSTVNDLEPEKSAGYLGGGNAMPDLSGRIVSSANLTPDAETGIGSWSDDDFVRAVRFGVRPDHSVLVYPMLPMPELSEAEVRDIYAYLRTVPPIHNAVPRPPVSALSEASAGKAAYYRYSCNSCHGDAGVGLYDLRKGGRDFPTDEALIAYVRDPQKLRPGVKMPTWDGVIAEEDYAPLAAYVRSLGAAKEAPAPSP
jgi:mono/diheme cytochrome c family protein